LGTFDARLADTPWAGRYDREHAVLRKRSR
jgi:hypothetical protein